MKLTGIKAHLWQRISAVYLLFYFPYLAFAFFCAKQTSSSLMELQASLFTVTFNIASFVAIALIITHAWIGLRDVIIDYLPDHKVNFWLNAYALFLLVIVIDLIWVSYMLFA